MGFGADSVRAADDVRRLVGAPDQLVQVDRLVRDEGPGRGAPVLVVRNPGGISVEVLLDRALDLGWADALGIPLAWRSARGPVVSGRHEPLGAGWTRTFGGGLLTTCGLASTGAAGTVGGVHHGLHGRIGHVPAENVRWALVDGADGPAVEITGDVVEAALGQPTLRLRRRIVLSTATPELRVEDVVTNDAFVDAGHMFRHHLNLGYPVVGPGTVVTATADPFAERDRPGVAARPFPWRLDVAPGAAPERVLYCRPHPGPTATVTVTAPTGQVVEVEQDTDAWPLLVLWRDPSAGVNVLGVEPSTSRDGGRAQAEADGELLVLRPGESRTYCTTVRLVRGPSATD
ncbi:DUF4432 family protein [Cellulomonas sp. C5510]|uniref:DUF4432 family protein n=1 Tax=Cellulomonas sp. C5510 TaxID=2871170 RepID=UPI001C93ED2C|nr:DUF4432 family protein [Cellulomonas sp. C5510]QZN85807.1 aldose 1-epimerase family protein [Cellulomonas sp. C5510]